MSATQSDATFSRIFALVAASAIVLLAMYIWTLRRDLDQLRAELATIQGDFQKIPDRMAPHLAELVEKFGEVNAHASESLAVQAAFQQRVSLVLKKMADRINQGQGSPITINDLDLTLDKASTRGNSGAANSRPGDRARADVPKLAENMVHVPLQVGLLDPILLQFPSPVKSARVGASSVVKVQHTGREVVLFLGAAPDDMRDRVEVLLENGAALALVPRIADADASKTVGAKVALIEGQVILKEIATQIQAHVAPGNKTIITFPESVVSGFKRVSSNLNLTRRGQEIELTCVAPLGAGGESILVRVADGQIYSVRALPANSQFPADIQIVAGMVGIE